MESTGTEEKTEGWIEFYNSFDDMFQFFCNNTTIHGTIRLNCTRRNKMKTMLWIVLFFFSFGMMYWQFGLMSREYWSYPTSLTISTQSESKIFPAVTICNLKPYRFNQVNKYINQLDSMTQEILSSFYEYKSFKSVQGNKETVDIEDILNGAIQINDSFKLDQTIKLVKLQENGVDPALPGQKKYKVGFQLCNSSGTDWYYKSYWSGVDAIQEWYKFHFMNIMSEIPIVLQFGGKEMTKGFIFTCEFNGKSCIESGFNHFHHPIYGDCFTFNSEGKDDFWKSSRTGKEYGLSVIAKAEQNDNLPVLSTAAGARVMIHNPFQPPLVEHESFDIWPETETSITIKQDELNHLGGVYGHCTTDGSDVNVKLLYNSTYTLQACIHSCFQYKMIELCGCGYYFYPLPPDTEHCNYNKYPGWGHCFYRLYEKMIDHQLSCFNVCPKPCRETVYQLSAVSAKWPASKFKEWVMPFLWKEGFNNTNSRSNISKVNLYYQDQGHRSSDETPLMSVTLFLSNMGSQWSLWFGSSVLSVAEIAELVMDTAVMLVIVAYQWQMRKKVKRNYSPPAINTINFVSGEDPTSVSIQKKKKKKESLKYSTDIYKCNFREKGDN